MAQEPNDIRQSVNPEAEPKPEEIREQMAETRASLVDKIEALEEKVLGTVGTAQATVEHTVESVKETVEDSVAAVKRTFDLQCQVEQRPWVMLGASVAAGYGLGLVYASMRPDHGRQPASPNGFQTAQPAPFSPDKQAEKKKPGWAKQLTNRFAEEIGELEGI